MTIPLVILAILSAPLATSFVLSRYREETDWRAGGVIGLALAFFFFGVGHFAQTQAMATMLPPWVPLRVPLIYATGVLEWTLAVGLLVPSTRRAAGWACVLVLIAFFPANVYAALNSVGTGGHQWGPVYLLIRAPLQLILVAWTYGFVIRRSH
jgi:uncharacterized membrane protein